MRPTASCAAFRPKSWRPRPRPSKPFSTRATLDQDTWQPYDTRNDFSLANDVAAANPARLKDLQAFFMKEAVKYNVLPKSTFRRGRQMKATPLKTGMHGR